MTRRRAIASAVLAGLLAVVAVLAFRTPPPPPASPPLTPAVAPSAGPQVITLDDLADPAVPPARKVLRIHLLVQNAERVLARASGPPRDSNREITKALVGANALGIRFLPPDHRGINARGELVDAWDTPYFFHRLAHDRVEVQSAGPDRIPFNSDDLIFPPPKPFDRTVEDVRSPGMRDGPRAAKRPPGG